MSDDNVMLEIANIPSVCLSMIVKNESAIICRLLDSVREVIDYACICDTGSTDDTVSIVNNYFETNNLNGCVITKEFVDFSTNRNYALAEAKKHGDYVLLLDADMKLANCDKFDKKKLDGRGYFLKQCGSKLVYYNLRLIPSNIESKYVGVTHEYLSFEGKVENHDTLYVDDKGDGGCKADKFTRDEKLLRKGLKDEPNNARYAFYLANTLRDLGKYEEAIKYYNLRHSIGGWKEELFYSQYQIGRCYEELGKERLMEEAYLNAWEMRPTRAEPLYDLAKYYRMKSKHARSWAYSTIGKRIRQPDDKLFVHSDKYGISFDRELSIVSYYVPAADKSQSIFKEMFLEDTRTMDICNFMFYCKQFTPDEVFDFSCTHRLSVLDNQFVYYGSSPCIIPSEDGYKMNIRLVNYRIKPDGSYIVGNIISTTNKLIVLDKQFNLVGKETIYTDIGHGRRIAGRDYTLHGVEDIRIVERSGRLMFTGTTCNSDNKIGMSMGEYKNDPSILEFEMLSSCEKNWVLIPGRDTLQIIYNWYPLCIKEVDTETGKTKDVDTKHMPSLFKHVRGSTNGIIYGNHIYFFSHIVLHGNPRKYIGIVSKFDLDMNFVGNSYPFKLSKSSIEYCLGMIIEDERIIFSYSENDGSSKVAVIDRKRFFQDHWMH